MSFAERHAGWIAALCLLLGCGLGALAVEAEAVAAETKADEKDRKAEEKGYPPLREQAAALRAEAEAVRGLRLRVALSLGPLVGALLFCLSGAASAFRRLGPARLAALACGLCAFSWLLVATPPPLGSGVDLARAPPGWPLRADLYVLAIVVAITAACVRAGHDLRRPGLSGAALAVWLLLWIPFDLRWTKALWEGPARLSYTGPAIWIMFVLVVAEGLAAGRTRALGLRLPRTGELKVLGGLTLLFVITILPAGFGLGFLEWNPQDADFWKLALRALGVGLVVALPEELFFRGFLDTRLRESLRGKRSEWSSLVASSLAFGVMHLNNRSDPEAQLKYFALASVAGAIYGLAFRRGGLWAAVALHTTVDVVWQIAFRSTS